MLILFFFFFPGLVQKVDQRLPVANEYLLLSGGAREGVLDLNPEELGDYAKGADFDLDFTLLVPALKLHDRNQVGAIRMEWETFRLFCMYLTDIKLCFVTMYVTFLLCPFNFYLCCRMKFDAKQILVLSQEKV